MRLPRTMPAYWSCRPMSSERTAPLWYASADMMLDAALISP